ncbi:MAG: TlpA disulfide reductase family protein [Mycobacteriales bacterium]
MVAAAVILLTGCASNSRPAAGQPQPLPEITTDVCPTASGTSAAAAPGGLPDLSFACLGHPGQVTLSQLRGVPLIVNLWASWCLPCRNEMPAFERLHQALRQQVRILGVDTKDAEDSARATIQATGISYPSVADPHGTLRGDLKALGLPVTLFVAADGRVLEQHLGELSERDMRDRVAKYFGITAAPL